MVSIPQLQIRQQYGRIGIDADPGRQSIEQPKAEVQIKTTPAKLDIHSPQGELEIDQSRAWDALGKGNILESMHRIYSQAHEILLQGIAHRVEYGNRLADISKPGNPIADNAEQEAYHFPEFDYYGPASMDNVDIRYTAHKPEIQVTEGRVDINVIPHKPVIEYIRGKLDIYMQQYPKVEYIPPTIDTVR
ncbi:DUF6470 family protein [Paenibacillus sp. CC-CFT747]|nr:DUF6470 family protein [Paenibacillus sp. CC-CFT747]